MSVVVRAMAGVLLFLSLSAAETAQAGKNDNVRAKPFIDGAVVATIKKGQTVDIQKREGSWYFVKIGAKTGWVPMLSVRRTQQPAASSSGSLTKTTTGRTSSGGVVSTTGIRGINEENLGKAEFSDSAVTAAEKYRVATDTAASFASEAGLQTRTVPPLSGPQSKGGKQ